jgi:hypothetical protein
MRRALARANRFLAEPLDLVPRLLMLAAAACLLLALFLPLWNLTMFAPQYQGGLRLDIYAHTLQGGNGGQDIKEINVLNHYIGMRDLANEDFAEFKWMPFAIGAIALLILRAVVHGTVATLIDGGTVFVYFGLFSLWSFGYKLYRYGHDLAPTAAMKIEPFTPPLFGYQRIANFEVYSYPRGGTYAMVAALLLLAAAVVIAWLAARREQRLTAAA